MSLNTRLIISQNKCGGWWAFAWSFTKKHVVMALWFFFFVHDFFLPAINLKLQCWNSAAKYVSHIMVSYWRMKWVLIFHTVCQGSVLI